MKFFTNQTQTNTITHLKFEPLKVQTSDEK